MVIDSIEIKTLEKFKLKFIRAIKHQIWSIYLHKTVGLKLRKYILRICNDIYNVVGICTCLSNGMCGVHIASSLAFKLENISFSCTIIIHHVKHQKFFNVIIFLASPFL